ncbi:MAG: DNA mismatch repair endonuclease MutL, partial [Rubrimonas sp.]
MHAPNRNILTEDPPPRIRRLSAAAANRIAAGEVIERPAAAVKELVENALDAGAARIDVAISEGGARLIRVADDGCGMTAAELPLALERHATSKIDGSDLLDIRSFGFRGEALPSMAAVGRLRIVSRAAGADAAFAIEAEAGALGPVRPAARNAGTEIVLRDLFFATPARLKFLRSERSERAEAVEAVRRLAMAAPHVAFTLRDVGPEGEAGRVLFDAPAETGDPAAARLSRLRRVLGAGFADDAVAIDADRDGLRLTGWAALPTYSRGGAVAQHLFVNGRPVRDRLLVGALNAAYADLLPKDRRPAAALFFDCDPQRVDVNVHPAKTEVRFREPGLARGLVVGAVRHALAAAGCRAAPGVAAAALGAA